MREITINDFKDVQLYQETYAMPYTCSITKWTIILLNNLFTGNETPDTTITFDPIVLPKSYVSTPGMWANKLRPKVKFPNLTGYKITGQVCIRASIQPFNPNFIQRLCEDLQHCNSKLVLDWSEVPLSFQEQPHVLISRLKHQRGFPNLIWRATKTKITLIPRNEITSNV